MFPFINTGAVTVCSTLYRCAHVHVYTGIFLSTKLSVTVLKMLVKQIGCQGKKMCVLVMLCSTF